MITLTRLFAAAAVASLALSGIAQAQAPTGATNARDAMMEKDAMAKDAEMKKDKMMKDGEMKKDAMMKDGEMKKDAMTKSDGMKKQ